MRLKHCFILVAILTILFSIGSVVASDNITLDESGENNALAVDEDILDTQQSLDNTDLSVELNVKDVSDGNKVNQAGFVVPWTVTVKVNGSSAKNTKVYTDLSDNLEYVSYDSTIGTFDFSTGIWDIGDLSISDNATLKIMTKLKENGIFFVSVNATTDSYDANLSNNVLKLHINSYTLNEDNDDGASDSTSVRKYFSDEKAHKKSSFTSKSSDKKNHGNHYQSMAGSQFLQKNDDENILNESEGVSKSTIDKMDSLINGNDSVVNLSIYSHVNTIILIFVVFLAILVAVIVRDKIKS